MAEEPSNEVLATKIDNLTGILVTHIDVYTKSQEKHEGRILENTLEVARLGERMNWITAGLVGLQVIGSGIAAFLGVR